MHIKFHELNADKRSKFQIKDVQMYYAWKPIKPSIKNSQLFIKIMPNCT